MNWAYVAFGCLGLAGSLIGWLWRHSTRLTRAETRIDGLRETAAEDRRRSEGTITAIFQQLARIEDKIDRKVDKA